MNPSEGIKSDAFSAGEDSEGNELYIGRGYFYETSAPGRLLFEDTVTKSAGLYVEFRNKEHQVVSDIEYLALNPACTYRWVASSSGDIVSNAIEITSVKTSYIGRKFALGSMHVGKVLLGSRMFFGLDGIGYSTNTYEVLVCDGKNSLN